MNWKAIGEALLISTLLLVPACGPEIVEEGDAGEATDSGQMSPDAGSSPTDAGSAPVQNCDALQGEAQKCCLGHEDYNIVTGVCVP